MYKNYTDEEIITLINDGNKQAIDYLINKYKKLVKIKTRPYFIIGADNEDIIQEGMVGLYKAIRDYKKGVSSFSTFAGICIDRQVITAIKFANRKKHSPLNFYLSLSSPIFENNVNISFCDTLQEHSQINPEDIFIDKENVKILQEKINQNLSVFEKKVLYLYLKGNSYTNIAKELKKNEKAIDNAIQRIRKKIIAKA